MTASFPAVTLDAVTGAERPDFARRLQAAFAAGIIAAGLPAGDEPVPSETEIADAADAPGAETLHVRVDGRSRGGAIVHVDASSGVGHLDFFFVDESVQGRGVGLAAWRALEQRFPSVEVWETMTPHFEQRNVHFYVNRCGFQILEFFHPGHPDPHSPHRDDERSGPGGGEPDLMFRFRKTMRRAAPHAERAA